MTVTPFAWERAAQLINPPHDEDRELAQKCASHLPTFLREAWPVLEPANPLVTGWHLDTICYHLEAVSAGELLRLIVNQPPRTLKSGLGSVMWMPWEWLTRAYTRWLFASYAADLATRDSLGSRRLIESRGGMEHGTIFQRLGYQGVVRLLHDDPWQIGPVRYQDEDGGPWKLTGDQSTKTRYDTTASGRRLSSSVGGLGTGEGGDRIVVDDPTNAEQALSPVLRDRANRWWDMTMVSRFNNAQAAAVIIMQRLHEDDLTGHLLAQGGWHHLCLPAEYEPKHPFIYPAKVVLPPITYNVQSANGGVESVTTKGGRALPGDPRTVAGELLEPVRLGRDKLGELKRSLGAYGFAGQIQQTPAPEEGGMFKRAWYERRWQTGFHRYLELGWDRVIQSWDMSFKDKVTSDYVVGQVWGFHGADCYLLAQARGQFAFTETLHVFMALTEMHPEATAKLVEDKANGTAVLDTLRRKVPGMIAIEPEGGKYVRAAAVSWRHEALNVILPASDTIPCPAGYRDEAGQWHALEPTTVADWLHEHASFPTAAKDDQVDAMSQALTWANPQPRIDVEQQPPGLEKPGGIMAGVMEETW